MKKTSVEPRISTYLHQKGRALGLPISGTFELTSRCNFSCPMCYIHEQGSSSDRELSAEQWLRLARSARDQGMVFALLTGGEPLVRKDFFEIYKGFKKLGLMISINTNGSLLNEEAMAHFLADPPTRLNISLYGCSEETYHNMCGVRAYQRVRENIRTLRKNGIDVRLNLSVTPYNCGDLEGIYRDAVELDVNISASSYMYPPVRTTQGHPAASRFSPDQSARYAMQWDTLRFEDGEYLQRLRNTRSLIRSQENSCAVDPDPAVRCRAGSTAFWITWDGHMLPCGMMTSPKISLQDHSFEEAWAQIKAETAQIRLPKACGECPRRDICNVCAAVCQSETGSFSQVPQYVCQRTDAIYRQTCEILRAMEENT